MTELQVHEADFTKGKAAVQPVPVFVLAAAHPSSRFSDICDVEALL